MKIGVVGSSGVLGGVISEFFSLRGFDVIQFSRHKNSRDMYFNVLDLESNISFAEIDLIVYCSWSTTDRSQKNQRAHANAVGHWAEYAKRQKCKFVFLSSVLAQENTKSNYGKYKYLAETLVTQSGGKSVRLGLVADDAFELLLTKIRRVDRKTGIVHKFCDFKIYAISTATLNNCLLEMTGKWPTGAVFWVAPTRAESLMRLIRPNGTTHVAKYSLFRLLPRMVAKFPTTRGKLGSYIDGVKGVLGQNVDPSKQSLVMPIVIDDFDWKLNLYL